MTSVRKTLQWEVTNGVSVKQVNWRKYCIARTTKKYYLRCQQRQEKEDSRATVVSYNFRISTETQRDKADYGLDGRGNRLILFKGQCWVFNKGQT